MNARYLVVPCLLGASLYASAYSTSFEPPTWTNGQSLAGTDGWDAFSDPEFKITNERARTGTQSVVLDTAPLVGSRWAWPNQPITSGLVVAKVWVYCESDPTHTVYSQFGLDAYSAAVSRIGTLRIKSNGDAVFGSSTVSTYALGLAADTWHELKLEMDLGTKIVKGFVNGNLVDSKSFTPSDFNDADLVGSATGFERGFYDDYEVVPEPATMAVLGIGVAALIRRRRR